MSVEIVSTIAEMRARIAAWRAEGRRVGLVPTMGALHEGHMSLVHETGKRCDRVIVSIFVNPAQFAPHEDFDRYPRDMDSDVAKIGGLAHLVFAPSVGEMYPDGFATRIDVGGPSAGLETKFRPHFFSGVATVVAKLLLAAMPDVATFGRKDYQQLLVIRQLVIDLGLPIEIAGGQIIREPDGLAMSSRNAYLNPSERSIAKELGATLGRVGWAVSDGVPIAEAEDAGRDWLLKAGFTSVDYVAVRDAATLRSVEIARPPLRILGAAWVGKTRLIDNIGS